MRVRAYAVATLAVALLAVAGCSTKVVTSDGATPLNTVTAAGTGKVSAAPTEAQMTFGVVVRSEQAEDALKQASDKAGEIASAIKGAGVADKDVQTQNVSVYPEYRDGGPDRAMQINGYTANVSVRVKIRDITKVGDVIGAASGVGSNEISGPTFTLGDDAPERDEAIEAAIADAKRRADVMAKAAGKSLGEIIAISEAGVSAQPIYWGMERAGADSFGYDVQPGELDVISSVTVVFELK